MCAEGRADEGEEEEGGPCAIEKSEEYLVEAVNTEKDSGEHYEQDEGECE